MTLAQLAAAHGVATSYADYSDAVVPVSEDAVISTLAALGVDAGTPEAVAAALVEHDDAPWRRLLPYGVVARLGRPATVALRAPEGTELEVHLEDGPALAVLVSGAVEQERDGLLLRQVALPDLPLGWHRLVAIADGRRDEAVLVVAPASLPWVGERVWGWMVQVYALRSAGSWGVGDYADLRTVVARTRADGGGVVLVNPLHAESPTLPIVPSPYSPSSRAFRSPLGLRVEDVPEHGAAPLEVQAAVRALKPPTDPDRVLRDPAWTAKLSALELLWPLHRVDALAAFRAERGEPLEGFALFCALAEVHGTPWQDWPVELRRPDAPGIATARAELAGRISFWCWVQLLVDEQLAAVTVAAGDMAIGVLHDLAVGVDAGGADAWALQDAMAMDTTVGAPPDLLGPLGQDWGLPPWRPDRLREQGWKPYRDLVQGVLRHAGGIRVDHVMGLFRLWWVPPGQDASHGTYVAYDADAMLGILALEAHRAGAVIVGEDLGTVEARVRDALSDTGVLGSAVLWFEQDDDGYLDPAAWRAQTAASVTTHDLPTVAGFLSQDQVRMRGSLGLLGEPIEDALEAARADAGRLRAMLERTGVLERAGGDELLAVHLALAESPSRVVLAALGDAVGDLRQPNVPGTVDEYPNWRLPLADASGNPLSLEQVLAHPGVARLAVLLREGVR